jgi:hypothetical protein
MAKITKTKPPKPAKPYDDFPLFAHGTETIPYRTLRVRIDVIPP